ncbi:hypothetical protein K227x_54360 [Rubripirellula lacrimiformis]|uniref:SseB protein N-terminal domain-containing protein n=1 Tax=Rubripirellula lacrimiformis TaxID=1930273 RepID=A0A517NIQ8_9BACT|nr:hypothetical protein [Rubripirellula lacrimiformis]QDT07012.1 hypothetical protein K227x_54360 [Rubripirellula lacrimiformis]
MATKSPFPALTESRNAESIRKAILAGEFVLISVADDEVADEGGDDEAYGALTAEIEDFEALVVFTSEEIAGEFVNQQEDLFGEGEEVEGIVVEGNALLEYLPEGYGMLFDPEFEDASVVDPALAAEVLAGGDDE